jgi:hypothetical protein
MADVRLKVNMIIDGKLYPRETVLDAELIPERFRNETHIEHDLQNREGVLLLRDLSFYTRRLSADGIATNFPTHVAAGELLDLSRVPESHRKSLKEGEDFKSDWSFADQAELRRTADDAYLKQFETEPVIQNRR